ncbi:MAG: ABC transporter permease [Ruminococcaceae bacterium]|nr:ABC transporter permease [Oscillospiraceae bacterium]
MRNIFTVFAYTFKIAAKKRAFIITTAVIISLVLILCSVPRLLNAFTGGDVDSLTEGVFYTCYYIDEDGMIPGGEIALYNEMTNTFFPVGEMSKLDEYRAEINDDSTVSVIIVENVGGAPQIRVIARDFMSNMSTSTGVVTEILSREYVKKTLAENGVSGELIDFSQTKLPIGVEPERNIALAGYTMGIVMITLVFFAVYYYGYGVASSIAGEKSSRVMETLIVSASPRNILIGKCLGMGALGLCQFGGILLFAVVCIKLLIPADFAFMGESLSFDVFTPSIAVLTVLFFVFGYALYAVLNAVCGATVNKIEDLNTAIMPVMWTSMLAFYFSYFTAIMGSNYEYLFKIAMYVPITAPFIMPFALLNGMATPVDIIISATILLVSIAVVTALSVRVYTASVMHYGKRMKLRDAYKAKM